MYRRWGRGWVLLTRTAGLVLVLGWGLAFDTRRGASTTISTSSSESICLCSSEGSPARATRRRFFRGLVIGVNIWPRFPFLRGDTRGAITGV
jgi:hypothetical protein